MFLPFLLSAQCLDCLDKTTDISVGVTLHSNMKFSTIGQTTQLLELNLRYKPTDNSTIRFGAPIALKKQIPGDPYPRSFTTDLDEYVENMFNFDKYPYYGSFYRVLDNYYNLYGFSLGYDYNLPLSNNLSAFIGCDLGYYYQKKTSKYFYLENGSIDEHRQFTSTFLWKTERIDQRNILSAKPLLGMRFTFQKLTFEADLAYHIAYQFVDINDLERYWSSETNKFKDMNSKYKSQYLFSEIDTANRIVYSLRLFYNF